jgi:hypothetical protein
MELDVETGTCSQTDVGMDLIGSMESEMQRLFEEKQLVPNQDSGCCTEEENKLSRKNFIYGYMKIQVHNWTFVVTYLSYNAASYIRDRNMSTN